MRYLFFLIFSTLLLWSGATGISITPYGVDANRYMKIRILDQLSLSYPNIDGQHFSEISDLAYDRKKHHLYMVSDQGIVFTFLAYFDQKIMDLKPLSAVKLVKKNGKDFKKWRHDSEGMTLGKNGKLLISFEGRAKIGSFGQDGKMRKRYSIPRKLTNPKNYRSRNKSLEALALHPKYGVLTAAEWPLKKHKAKEQTIYAMSGKEWHFKAENAASSAVVGMEVMDDGNLLILERAYSGLSNPVVITLKKVWLHGCKKGRKKVRKKMRMCKSEVLAQFNSGNGWRIDNFEGLTKVGKNRYAIISDDNDNFYQRTILLYFEVLDQ